MKQCEKELVNGKAVSDIEENIKKIDGVKECVVIAKYDCNCCVKVIKAFLVLEEGIEEVYVKNELKKLLPAYMIPKSIIKIDEMPINNNYKIDRKQLSNL